MNRRDGLRGRGGPWVVAGLAVWLLAAGVAGGVASGQAAPVPPDAGPPPAEALGAGASPELERVGWGERLWPGVRLERTLTVHDPRLDDDTPFHAYWFEADQGQVIILEMRSDQVDPYLWLFGPDAQFLARDDDSGPGPYDARIRLTAPASGRYQVLANTALSWQRGTYQLAFTLEEAWSGSEPGWRGEEGRQPTPSLPRPPARGPGEGPSARGLVAAPSANPRGAATPPTQGALQPGLRRSGRVGATELIHFWLVELPEGQDRFEVGLFNATGPLDLVATPEDPVEPGVGDFPFKAMTGRENERLEVVLEAGGPRRWLVGVVNWEPVSIGYEIEVAFDRPLPPYPEYKPPLPQVIAALNPLERAIRATVQISTPEGSASGTLLTPDGFILTNYHVVGECRYTGELFGCEGDLLRDERGEPVELVVGLAHEARGAATQYFVAEVVRTLPEYDLALLQITHDLNGLPVRGPIFPWIPVDLSPDGVRLGDEVMVLGYPAIAQTAGRIPLSLTRGILSGFTLEGGRRVLLQTDAAIEAGHSGGALIRLPEARLVGVPSDTRIDWETFEKQNYARPVSLIPEEWRQLLRAHGATFFGWNPEGSEASDPPADAPAGSPARP
ncbi:MULTISPECIES: trypsin-like peptidase domain-containing protein [Limnochorda]|uniref:trypsin-like peptidase domain-containing protein n=1 Tax=Limnochorda TaxID=1676651 RepID=UPI0026F20BE2|nr:trypsin-like peptidase domain-containing protein [Limnochorda pilosa]